MPLLPPMFRPSYLPTPAEQNRDTERTRGSAGERGYGKAWSAASLGYRKAHPLCLGCSAVGRVSEAALVDHVVPHKSDRALFWDRDNWQPSCRWHHDVVKQKIEALYIAGKATKADLRLDSALAKKTTISMQ